VKDESPKDTTPSVPAIRASIFRSTQTEPLSLVANAVSSDGAMSTALAQSSETDVYVGHFVESAVSSAGVFARAALAPLSVMKQRLIAPASDLLSGKASNRIALQHSLNSLRSWWSRERKDRACHASLPNEVLDGMIVEGETFCSPHEGFLV
jgi:hypothetical protein